MKNKNKKRVVKSPTLKQRRKLARNHRSDKNWGWGSLAKLDNYA